MKYYSDVRTSRTGHSPKKASPLVAMLYFMLLCAITHGTSAVAVSIISDTFPPSIPDSIVADWKLQDSVGNDYSVAIQKIRNKLPTKYASKIPDSASAATYLAACHWRRVARIQPHSDIVKKIVYARHHDIGGLVIGYTEDLPDDGKQGIGKWGMDAALSIDYVNGNKGGTALHLLEFKDYYPLPTDIITDSVGCLRDPCPTYNGDSLVFAWSQDNFGYHLFTIDLAGKTTTQLTHDPSDNLFVSDMEPCITPSGDIVFCSSRCFQADNFDINVVSNLYICNREGKYLRRISYDQSNIFYPTMVTDGTIMYTRWEFNDRNFQTIFGIFTMNQDGARQNEFFGNQTSFPATFNQARQIPGQMKALATTGALGGGYNGDLCIVDAEKARNGSASVQYIAPKRTVKSNSATPEVSRKFQNPYPINDEWFLISYRKTIKHRFQIFLMNTDGERELLAWGNSQSVSQPVPLMKRKKPIIPSYQADYTKSTAEVAVSDVYYGTGTNPDPEDSIQAVPRGSVKKIRVVALEYRTYPAFGFTGSDAIGQLTPVGRFMCSWDAKWIVGEAPVGEDGSAAFEVPPRTPIFLQLIDKDGLCIQTMRSWMTLQPGERFDCFGCHEDKNQGMPEGVRPPSQIQAKPLAPFYDLPRKAGSFHFPDVIQPVLTRNCVRSGCHDASHAALDLTGDKWLNTNTDLAGDGDHKEAFRTWLRSYWNLSKSKYVNCSIFYGKAEAIKPNSSGSPKSALTQRMLGESAHAKNITTFQPGDREKIMAWIDLAIPHSGTYSDDMQPEHATMYQELLKRREVEEAIEAENIASFIADGGYLGSAYGGTGVSDGFRDRVPGSGVSASAPNSGRFTARFSSLTKQMSIRLPSEGTILVINLAGKQLVKRTFGKLEFRENAAMQLPVSFPAGIYIVRFRGLAGTMERVVAVF